MGLECVARGLVIKHLSIDVLFFVSLPPSLVSNRARCHFQHTQTSSLDFGILSHGDLILLHWAHSIKVLCYKTRYILQSDRVGTRKSTWSHSWWTFWQFKWRLGRNFVHKDFKTFRESSIVDQTSLGGADTANDFCFVFFFSARAWNYEKKKKQQTRWVNETSQSCELSGGIRKHLSWTKFCVFFLPENCFTVLLFSSRTFVTKREKKKIRLSVLTKKSRVEESENYCCE